MKRKFYKMNDKVFLLNTKNEVTPKQGTELYWSTNGENITLFEMQDITTEMETGASYSLYVDSVEFFDKPTEQEIQIANNYLNSLN